MDGGVTNTTPMSNTATELTKFEIHQEKLEKANQLIGQTVFAKTAAKGEPIKGVVLFVTEGMVDFNDERGARVLLSIKTNGGWVCPCEFETVTV